MNPYTDFIESDSSVIRVFDQNIDPIELKWHRDLEDRRITVLEGSGWYYQKEDELPIELLPGVDIFIRALEWHRVIKGETSLKIKIQS
jgi:quercetin dioxygenase-like cupin family protein